MKTYDIAVCGGGLAGCGAAIHAARSGRRVLLVERLEMLGGLGTAGCVANFCAARGGLQGQGQVFDDIIARLRDYRAIGEENGWPVKTNEQYARVNWTFDHNYLSLVLQELALEAGVSLLYATDVIGADVRKGRIEAVVLHNRSLQQRISADVHIDATGDGVLSRHAGGRALPDDPALPGVIKPSNMMFMRRGAATTQPPPAEPVCEDGVEPDYSVWPGGRDQVALKMKLFHRILDTSTGDGYSDAVITMRKAVPHFASHYMQNKDASSYYAGVAPMLGLRESVRIEGETILRIADCRAGRRFDDAVAYGTFTVDANETAEILPPYQIPYGSLLVRGTTNCLVVGRCFSADRLALSSARTMATGCLMGQAAGAAASLAAGGELRSVNAAAVRQELFDASGNDKTLLQRLGDRP